MYKSCISCGWNCKSVNFSKISKFIIKLKLLNKNFINLNYIHIIKYLKNLISLLKLKKFYFFVFIIKRTELILK